VSSRDGEREQEDLTDFSEGSLQFRDSAIPQSTSRRSPFSERRSYSGSDHARGDATDDIDLQRLEESVRRLQREAAVSRARPPAEELGAQGGDGRVQRRRADTYIDGYRVPPSLQPEVLTPPAELRGGHGRLWTVMSMLIASAVAAPIAYYFASGPSSSDTKIASAESSRPTVETLTVTAPAIPARPPRAQERVQERVDVASVPEASPVTVVPRQSQRGGERTPPPQTAERPPVQTAERTPVQPQRIAPLPPQRAMPPVQNVERAPPAPAPVQSAERSPPPAPAPSRSLDPGEIDVLVKQGQQFVAAGDFVTARLVFQRAAEAGNAAAALALGASYDPVVLSRLGVRGVDADVGKARTWYQKAKEYGAPDADRRLSTLANR
jgi:hypothetical protein